MAPHSHPHLPSFLVFSSLTLPSSLHPAARPWGHAPQTLHLGERGPGGARITGGPRESEVVPATPWAVGAVAASAGHGGKTAAAATTGLPYVASETVGSDPPLPTNLQAEAGSRGASFRLRHCSVGPGTWTSSTRGGWGGARVSGERQVRPRGASGGARLVAGSEPESRAFCRGGVLPEARVGSGLREPVRKHGGPPTFAPEVSRGTAAPLQEPGCGWRAPVGKVRDPGKLQPESGGKKGVGSHKPPRVKVIPMNRQAWEPLISTALLPHDFKKTQLQLLLDYLLCPRSRAVKKYPQPNHALHLQPGTSQDL
ncbi:uncharacterized protein LOC132486758 [Mesoplodon densirostris]|uniref:uncharacterized protein LOC132486758 n=1 Tax=Mesoplodon densirostris TaxID=48708 RepID=UPI0028DB1E8F|nr:uncharacterized protein LOC132486758 [Mesoplodon densirostris]